MRINGSNAFSKSILIGPNENASIEIKNDYFDLVFDEKSNENKVSIFIDGNKKIIKFDGTYSALGNAVSIAIPLKSGGRTILSICLYTIGDSDPVFKFLNYTYRDDK